MFPHPTSTTEGLARPWRDSLRRALDTVVAFATLADDDVADEPAGPPDPSRSDGSEPAVAEALAAGILPATAAARAARLEPRPADRSGAPLAGVAPATAAARAARAKARQSDPSGVPATGQAPHPHLHRRALRAPARSRRPGAVRAAPQPCLTPLPARHTASAHRLVPAR